MNTEQLKQIIRGKQVVDFETGDQDFEHGLRLVLRDVDSGELGLLAVEPRTLVLPDESVLEYSYQVLADERPEPEHSYDIKTPVGREANSLPF
jgi:hypothetical protein